MAADDAENAENASRLGVFTRSRTWSWIFGIGSFALPVAVFAYRQQQLSEWLAQQEAGACGLAFLAVLFQSLALALLLSLAAVAFGLRSYLRLPRPRPRKRLIETVALGSASLVMVVAAVTAWLIEAL